MGILAYMLFSVLPLISLILSWIFSKKFRLAILTIWPHIIPFVMVIALGGVCIHQYSYLEPLVRITPNFFNIAIWMFGVIWAIMINFIIKNKVESKKKRIANSVIFFITYVMNFMLIQFILGSCQ